MAKWKHNIVGKCHQCGMEIERSKTKTPNYLLFKNPLVQVLGKPDSFLIHRECLLPFIERTFKEVEFWISSHKQVLHDLGFNKKENGLQQKDKASGKISRGIRRQDKNQTKKR